MSIIIPSKSIYSVKNNKIVKNQYDKIEVNATDIHKENDYSQPVLTTATDRYSYETEIDKDAYYSELAGSSSTLYEEFYAYIKAQPIYSKSISFTIPKFFSNKFVQKLLTGLNDQNQPNIRFTVYSQKYVGTATSSRDYQYGIGYIKTAYNKPVDSIDEIKLDPSYSFSHYQTAHGTRTVTATLDFNNLDNVATATYTEDSKNYYITLTILTGYERITLGGFRSANFQTIVNNPLPVSGDCVKYIPQKIEVTFYGNTIGIDIKQEVVTVGDKNGKNLLSISNNELLQKSNFYGDNNLQGQSLIYYHYNNTLNSYIHGKETATLLCSIKDYYNEDKSMAISPNNGSKYPMTFNVGDIVVPMVNNFEGKDVPMSVDKSGKAKEFLVVGVNLKYDGAVWQELSLQEYYSVI